MTVAVDKKTGKVVGQLVFQCAPLADSYAPAGMREPAPVRIFTAEGYRYVDAASVRLERTGD